MLTYIDFVTIFSYKFIIWEREKTNLYLIIQHMYFSVKLQIFFQISLEESKDFFFLLSSLKDHSLYFFPSISTTDLKK